MSTWEQNEQLARDIANVARGLDTIIARMDSIDHTALIVTMAHDLNTMSNAVANLDERMSRMETVLMGRMTVAKVAQESEQHRIRAMVCEEALRKIRDIAESENPAQNMARDLVSILEIAQDVLGDNEE